MICAKCGYFEKKAVVILGVSLCKVCCCFAPENEDEFREYVSEKIDWKLIDSFRRFGVFRGLKQKKGMEIKARQGKVVCRPALGYDVFNGGFVLNKDASKVHSLFKFFLNTNHSLNFISKEYGLSVNGLKKVLQNRTYLGELKFDGKLNKSNHKAIISPEIFYAVQRKLNNYLKPRKYQPNKYVLKGMIEPLKENVEKSKNTIKEIKKDNNLDSNLYTSFFN